MKIAIISDTHLGYARFEEDSFIQAERAFLDAQTRADLIICAGDVFDIKVPKLETMHRAMGILKKVHIPVYAIHGNHERRSKDLVNPVQLLAQVGLLHHVHGEAVPFEKDGERLQIFGMGNVPEDWARAGLQAALKRHTPDPSAFRVLVLHQSIRELIPQAEEEISVDDLADLPFDLIINGHIHTPHVLMKGRLLIPGSTVITQLKKEEMASKGYLLYDTRQKTHEFVSIHSRPFFFEQMEFREATVQEVREQVEKRARELRTANPGALVRIKVLGTLSAGANPSDINVEVDGVQIDNMLGTPTLRASLERIRQLREEKLSVREMAVKELRGRTQDLTLFDPMELFDKLLQDEEGALGYLKAASKAAASVQQKAV